MISRFMKTYSAMSLNAVLNMSYPQFKTLYSNIYNDKTFAIVVPYLGSSEKSEEDKNNEVKREIQSKGKDSNVLEINSIVAQMNREFRK